MSSSAVSVAVVGGGFGGIGAAIALRERGVRDMVVFERSDRLGGVWQHNSYPGAACDVPSSLYSYSFAPNPSWTRKFSPGAEIRSYLEDCARRFGVADAIRTGVDVSALRGITSARSGCCARARGSTPRRSSSPPAAS